MYDYCEMPEFFSDSRPVARKEHICCECGTAIEKGEKHYSCSGKWDGDFLSYRQHLDCLKACETFRDKVNEGECIPFGGFYEWMCETKYYHRNWPAEVRTIMAKALWRVRKGINQRVAEKRKSNASSKGEK